MRARMYVILCCLAALCGVVSVGCSKKAPESKSVTPAGAPSATAPAGAPGPAAPAGAPAVATSPQTTPAAALTVDPEKPLPEVQAQAQTLNVDDLKAIALKYKQALADKQGETEKLVAKIKELPVTQALGQEGRALQTDLQSLQTSMKALTDRFQIYYNTLKDKGGNLSGL